VTEYYLDDSVSQPFWDNSVEPRLEIESGDTVVIECAEGGGQVTPNWSAEDLSHLDFDKIHALTGSIFVKEARPGDVLEVEILDMKHKGWGWPDDFDFNYLHHWRLDGDTCYSSELDSIHVPFEPHPGCIGVAPQENGRFSTLSPSSNGGNMDVRDMTIGSTVWLPVLVEGALFATGDCHAAQGQGEVCVTGIESPMTVTMRFHVRKNMKLKEAQLHRPSPITKADRKGYHITTAHGPDLYKDAQTAVRYMIEWLVDNHHMNRSQAYMLCSVTGDLKISQIVDAPNWVVSMHMPRMIFEP
jgi:acetamidase/formamidase